jgi:hypothetical protein
MMTALLLILPAIGMVILGLIAKTVVSYMIPDFEPIRPVSSNVAEVLSPVEREHHDAVPVRHAA